MAILSPLASLVADITSTQEKINSFFDTVIVEEKINSSNQIIINSGVEKISEGVFEVIGDLPEKLINSTNFTDYESLQYLQRALIKSGIVAALREKGAKEGDTVIIDESQFDFVE